MERPLKGFNFLPYLEKSVSISLKGIRYLYSFDLVAMGFPRNGTQTPINF